MKPNAHFVSLLAGVLLATLAPHGQPAAAEASAMALTISSSAFGSGAGIPSDYSCKGADTSPPLEWSGAPAHTASFALIMDDPDAPGGTWVHWVMWNLPPKEHSLPQGEPKEAQLSDGAHQGQNSFRRTGYNGPCPPAGSTHRYFFRLYALDCALSLPASADRTQLDAAMRGHVLAQAELMGKFHS